MGSMPGTIGAAGRLGNLAMVARRNFLRRGSQRCHARRLRDPANLCETIACYLLGGGDQPEIFMALSTITVHAYSGGPLTLTDLALDPTVSALGYSIIGSPGDLRDGDGTLSIDDDGNATFQGLAVEYVGKGTFTYGMDAGGFLPMSPPVDVVVFNSAGTSYFYFPNGDPILLIGSDIQLLLTDDPHEFVTNPFLGTAGNDDYRGGPLNNTITGDIGDDTLGGAEGDDFIDGGAGNDKMRGGDGDDEMVGGDGMDSMIGGDGDDTLDGGLDNDRLAGRSGADSLAGGAGDDVLRGGAAADVFLFAAGGGADRIIDFADDEDTLELDEALWGGGKTVADVLTDHATVVGSNTVFTFTGGETLIVRGIADVNLLVDDIALVV
jgi:Ca2+-binding RTX toxin-like protein